VPAFVVEAWVRPLVAEANGERIRLLCPSALHRERVRERFLPRIRMHAAVEAGKTVEFDLDLAAPGSEPCRAAVEPRAASDARDARDARAPSATADAARGTRSPAARERPRPSGAPRSAEQHSLPYSFDNFVVGACNRLAREASLAVAHGTQRSVNPLYLASAPGLGKTHLARAIAGARAQCDARVIYASAEAFTNQFTGALRNRKIEDFKRRFRSHCDLLVVEDVQFLGGKRATQLELFHTLSHLVAIGARVVLTADRLPGEIGGIDERLRSHMSAGLVATLERPDSLVRREILRAKAAHGGVRLPDDCLDRLVDGVRGSVRDLEGALVQLVTTSSLLKRPIDLELTEQALAKVAATGAPQRRLSIEAITEVVAKLFATTPAALAARSRRREVRVPRQLAMYLCRIYTQQPAAEIARAFGRLHPSVSNAAKVVERQLLESAPFRYKVEAITARLDELERGAAQR
jgi:chromosomal replication initiator protein